YSVDSGNDRFVEITGVIQSAKPGGSPVRVRFLAGRRGFQIPTGGEKLFARAGNDGNPQLGVVAVGLEDRVEAATGSQINGVGFRAVERDLENGSVAGC